LTAAISFEFLAAVGNMCPETTERAAAIWQHNQITHGGD